MRTPTAPKKPRFKQHPLSIAVRAACYSMLGALPLAQATTGGQVVGGSGMISQSGTNTTINQATQNLAINWQTFNVAANERVQFIQPNATSIALNRVISNNGSVIAGRIDANGRVILVNPNGVFFSSTAVLNVGSIIASGLDINPADFMKGQYIFNEIGGTSGKVVNSGLINASLGGNVALIGKQVKNDGVITANLGTVTLAAGKQAVLTFDNAGLLGVRVSQEILQSELGVDPAVINSGDIQAQGGRVLLTASQSQDVFSRAVNTTGMEPATSVVVHDDGTFTLGGGADVLNSGTINTSTTSAGQTAGRIVLIGENVASSGTLKADAQNGNGGEIELHARDTTLLTQNSVTSARSETNGKGGIVKVLGDKVGLFDQSTVDVSGAHGGGQALIGGDFQGKNAKIRNARRITVAPGSSIFADANKSGNGGKIILWADEYTRFFGSIFARGGSEGGNGGFAEVSGKEGLQYAGLADLTAASGQLGTLLLDPQFIRINNNTSGATFPGSYNDFADGGNTSDYDLNAATLSSQLNTANVRLQANTDIFVENDISITATVTSNAGRGALALHAGRSISFGTNATITLLGGAFEAIINHQGAEAGNRIAGFAEFTMGAGSSVVTNGGTISITTGTFAGDIGNITLQTLNSNGRAAAVDGNGRGAGSITVNNSVGDVIVNGQISANGSNGGATGDNDGGNANTITLTANNINVLGAITSNGGNATGTGASGNGRDVTLTVDTDLTVAANISSVGGTGGTGGNVTFSGNSAANTFNINNAIALAAASVTINGNGGIDRLVRGGTATNNTWEISGTNTGNLAFNGNTITFNDVENLTGGTLVDNFTLTSGSLDGLLDGGGGSADTLTLTAGVDVQLHSPAGVLANQTGRLDVTGIETITDNSAAPHTVYADNTANSWTIDATGTTVAPSTGADTENTVRLENFTLLNGGTGIDTFAISATYGGTINGGNGNDFFNINIGATVSGTLNGDAGNDSFDILADASSGTLNGGADNDTFRLGAFGTAGTIDGGTETIPGGDTLVARQGVANTWNFTSTNSGSLAQVGTPSTTYVSSFSNVENFSGGGTGAEWANFSSLGAVSINAGSFVGFAGVIGGAGSTLNGTSGNDQFTVQIVTDAIPPSGNNDGTNDGRVVFSGNTLRFIDFATLNGVDGFDTFTIDATGSVSGAINGGLGSSTLVGRNTATTWTLTGSNTGTVGITSGALYVANFSNIQNLTGGTDADSFVFNNGSSLTGTLNGGAGIDNVNMAALATVNVTLGATGFSNIEAFVGNNTASTLTGDNALNTWALTGQNDGTVNGITFTDFNNLVGGNTTDTFTFGAGSSLTGLLNGGLGTDSVNMAALATVNVILGATGFSNIEQITGNNTASTLTGDNTLNTWTLTGQNDGTVNGLVFTDFNNLTGGTGNDTFIYNIGGSLTGLLNGGLGTDSVNLAALATVNVILGATGFSNIEQIIGNNTASTLTGDNTPNTWTLSGQNDGTVNGLVFTDFNNLTGGNQTDTFTFGAGSSLTGLLNGGLGTDSVNLAALTTVNVILGATGFSNIEQIIGNNTASTLTGDNTLNTWALTGQNDGTVNGITFTDFNNLVGGNTTDTFTFGVGSSLTGLLNGGLGTDSVNMAALTTVNVVLGQTVTNVEQITGNNTASTLTGENIANTWAITGPNDGTVNGVTFTNINNLVGGTAVDTFTVAGGSINTIDMGAGNDFFTITGGTVDTVDGNTGNDTFSNISGTVGNMIGGLGIDSIVDNRANVVVTVGINLNGFESVTAANGVGTINGLDVDSAWTIDGFNSGRVLAGAEDLFFVGFTTLNGGSAVDTYTVSGSGSITGVINGNGGNDILNVRLSAAQTGGIVNFAGGVGTDSVTISNAAGDTTTFAATRYNPAQAGYDQIIAGNNVSTNYASSENVTTSVNTTTLVINGSGAGETIQLGNGTFTVGGFTPVNYSSVANVTVNGQAGNDLINLNNVNLAGGTLSLTAEAVTGDTLTANTLILDNVGQFGATGSLIDTDIVTLQMANTGPVYINETDNLNINTTGSVTNSGIFRIVGGTTTINAGGGSLTLDNAENDFDTVNVTNAASVTLRDRNSIARGNMTADSITLTTATGIGGATVDGASNDEFVTNTADLTVNNASGGVYITNNGSATVAITNSGDIGFTNNGNLIVDKLYTGGVGFMDRSLYRNVRLNVNGGSVQGIQGIAGRSIYDTPDITAFDLRAIVQGGGGFGNVVRPISISVSDTFTYLGGRGYVHYFGARPPHIFGADDLVIFSALDTLSSLRLLEVESLDEFDPAIFTEVRNYYYEDVAIMMPADQRLDAVDEDEKEKDEGKEGKL